jgi:glc operon protein GlcG
MDEGLVIRGQVAVTLAGAQAVVSAAAREIGVDECIAVVDRAGALVAFARMDAARIGSVQVALTKAVSAATRRRPTVEENAGDVALGIRLALAANKAVTYIGGGLPIVVDGQVIGAVGVSSRTVDEDVLVAQAGLAPLATL